MLGGALERDVEGFHHGLQWFVQAFDQQVVRKINQRLTENQGKTVQNLPEAFSEEQELQMMQDFKNLEEKHKNVLNHYFNQNCPFRLIAAPSTNDDQQID